MASFRRFPCGSGRPGAARSRRLPQQHWGTFEHLTDEALDEPPRLLALARDAAGLAVRDFDVMKIGETRAIEPARGAQA